jgi:hypothetical protein
MPGVRAAVRLAQEMGTGLGLGRLLQRPVPLGREDLPQNGTELAR